MDFPLTRAILWSIAAPVSCRKELSSKVDKGHSVSTTMTICSYADGLRAARTFTVKLLAKLSLPRHAAQLGTAFAE